VTTVAADHAELRARNRAVVEAFFDPEQRARRLELFEDGVWREYFKSSVLLEALSAPGAGEAAS
jgi:hypothetical protein